MNREEERPPAKQWRIVAWRKEQVFTTHFGECPRQPPGIQRRRGPRCQPHLTVVETRKHVAREAPNPMLPDPALIRIDHGASTASAAAVNASCEEICDQSRSPRINAPVGS